MCICRWPKRPAPPPTEPTCGAARTANREPPTSLHATVVCIYSPRLYANCEAGARRKKRPPPTSAQLRELEEGLGLDVDADAHTIALAASDLLGVPEDPSAYEDDDALLIASYEAVFGPMDDGKLAPISAAVTHPISTFVPRTSCPRLLRPHVFMRWSTLKREW